MRKLSDPIPTLPSGKIEIESMGKFGQFEVTDRNGKFAQMNINDIFDLINKMALQYADEHAINWINEFNKNWDKKT